MIKPKDAIRCRSCGYRIMYKARTKRGKRIKGMARLFVTQSGSATAFSQCMCHIGRLHI